jgi:3',5'-cyclic AMP phosphodiesterase CpdA
MVGRFVRVPASIVLVAVSVWAASAQTGTLPSNPDSVKFAVLGDLGTGERPAFEIAQQMVAAHAQVPFETVVMVGDNMQGGEDPRDFIENFEKPFDPLLKADVLFLAVLGNHDTAGLDRNYKSFNMGGQRYYTFVRKNVRFFVIDTNDLDRGQVGWLDTALEIAPEDWKICFFHHPIYSDARAHGSDLKLRAILEPLMVRHGVNVVFSGHDHVYERSTPQKGIVYFVTGAGGELRKGDVKPTANTAAYFDQDRSFVVVEIDGDTMHFEAISRVGQIVDSGVILRTAPN